MHCDGVQSGDHRRATLILRTINNRASYQALAFDAECPVPVAKLSNVSSAQTLRRAANDHFKGGYINIADNVTAAYLLLTVAGSSRSLSIHYMTTKQEALTLTFTGLPSGWAVADRP
jgi:hypothetical protein